MAGALQRAGRATPTNSSKQCLPRIPTAQQGWVKPAYQRIASTRALLRPLSDDFRELLGHETHDRIVQLSGEWPNLRHCRLG